MRTTCEKCGQGPVKLITSRRHLGMIFYGKTWSRQALLCKDHARQLLAGDLAFTSILGWWGVLSLFINLGIVVAQIAALSELAGLGAPQPLPGQASPPPAPGQV